MARFTRPSMVLFFAFLSFTTSQTITSLNPSICASGSPLTTFSACNYLYSQLNYCAGPSVASGAPAISCYCNQQVFNAFYDCESEQRLCYLGTDLDGDISTGIADWHTACDKHLSFAPTTPVLSNPPTTYSVDYCVTAQSACQSAIDAQNLCSVQYTGKSYSSCFCQPQILRNEYTCGYLGNLSCLATPATVSSLVAFQFCDNAQSVLGTGGSLPFTVVASSTSSASAAASSSAGAAGAAGSSTITTKPALPGSSSTGSAPLSTSTTSSDAEIAIHMPASAFIGLLLIALLAVV